MNKKGFGKTNKTKTPSFATKKEMQDGFDKLTTKIDGVEKSLNIKIGGLRADIADLKESNEVLTVKMDALINTTENFINKVETEEQERKFGDKQLERRVEKLEAKV